MFIPARSITHAWTHAFKSTGSWPGWSILAPYFWPFLHIGYLRFNHIHQIFWQISKICSSKIEEIFVVMCMWTEMYVMTFDWILFLRFKGHESVTNRFLTPWDICHIYRADSLPMSIQAHFNATAATIKSQGHKTTAMHWEVLTQTNMRTMGLYNYHIVASEKRNDSWYHLKRDLKTSTLRGQIRAHWHFFGEFRVLFKIAAQHPYLVRRTVSAAKLLILAAVHFIKKESTNFIWLNSLRSCRRSVFFTL